MSSQHGGHSLRIQPNALVWCKLKGFSELWAGQIVDPLKATEEALAMKQPGTFLVSFFPDSAFQWVPPDKIFDFEEHLEKYSKGARGKVSPAGETACSRASRQRGISSSSRQQVSTAWTCSGAATA